jgi:hypothetical protein
MPSVFTLRRAMPAGRLAPLPIAFICTKNAVIMLRAVWSSSRLRK